jgi:hypothetical protein
MLTPRTVNASTLELENFLEELANTLGVHPKDGRDFGWDHIGRQGKMEHVLLICRVYDAALKDYAELNSYSTGRDSIYSHSNWIRSTRVPGLGVYTGE